MPVDPQLRSLDIEIPTQPEVLVKLSLLMADEDVDLPAISALVMDMLTFSKEREPELAVADLNRVVSEVIELMQSRAEELGVELQWHPGEGIPELVFDPEGIHRAVLNVVTNALDAAAERGEGGAVVVRTGLLEQEESVQVIVEDNGPGISREQMRTLFSPFASTKGSRGTGLGLPVSQKIVNEHGGRILVESTPGQGARFTLQWPAVLPGCGPRTSVS